jgi:hypothetical protein
MVEDGRMPQHAFTGFPEAALDFYDDLELDNSKAFWDAHRLVDISALHQPSRR